MEYLQSFLIVVMETICFFLFQDAFISSKKRYKSGIYAIWIWEYPKVCVNLQTGVRYNYSVWRFLLWQEEKVTHHRKQQCAK